MTMMNFFGIFIGVGGLVIVNAIGYSTSSICRSRYNCDESSPYNIVMIVLGVVLLVLCIIFSIKIQYSLNGIHRQRSIQPSINNQNDVLQPNNLAYQNSNRMLY